MNIIAQFNTAIGQFVPVGVWDFLQVIVGFGVVVGVILQRRFSERFQTAEISTWQDRVTIRMGQLGLAGVGTMAFLVMLDGLLPGQAPPRTFTIVFLTSYILVQTRVLFEAVRSVRRGRCPL